MKIDPYYQLQKCSPGCYFLARQVLCGYWRRFAGESGVKCVKWEWGRWKWLFSLRGPLYQFFRTFTSKATVI